jgi:DNA-binding SARP family transcriptional activator
MEILLLGTVEWRSTSGSIPIPRPQDRLLLAALAMEPRRFVPVARLSELLWKGAPPRRPATGIQGMASQLRRTMRESGADATLISRRGAYALDVPADCVDVQRFRRLVSEAQAAGVSPTRVERFAEALALWRGPALADLGDGHELETLRDQLQQAQQQAHRAWIAAHVDIGEPTAVLAPLTRWAENEPLNEHAHALLMRALYQAGRRFDALMVYRRARRRLTAELGAEPGLELQACHQAILKGNAIDQVSLQAAALRAGRILAPGSISGMS